jgi:hypothetical protein
VIASGWSWVHNAAPLIGVAGTASLGLVLGMAAIRWRARRRALADRVKRAVVPIETFDPPEEEILRYAHQLARARRALPTLAGKRVSAVTVRLDSVPGGRLLYVIEAPSRARSIVEMGGLDGVELVDPEELDPLLARWWPMTEGDPIASREVEAAGIGRVPEGGGEGSSPVEPPEG